jgi:hypothetical protein
MPKYINCTNQVWKDALHRPLTPVTLPINVQLIIMEYNTVSSQDIESIIITS